MAQTDNKITGKANGMLDNDLQWWLDTTHKIYFSSLVIGIIAALAFVVASWLIIRWQSEIQTQKETAFEHYKTSVTATIASANAAAESAKADAAKAAETAAKASQTAAAANLELAKLNSPRTLTAQQQKKLIELLKPYAGTKFDVAVLRGDAETESLLEVMESLLQSAGWVQIDWKGEKIVFKRDAKPLAGVVNVSGVIIQVHPDQVNRFSKSALALAASLNTEGIDTRPEAGLGVTNNNPDALHLLIGKKL